MRVAVLSLSVLSLLSVRLVGAAQDSGSVIPAESRPCVDCHAFEFMQRALQDLKKTAYNLDTRAKELPQTVPAPNGEGKKMYKGEEQER
ncbi:Neuropeptide-like protein C4orf48 like protein [Willisornis vidua]|uniref:NELL2-interacting cell ontogeny regulator 1 n=1 Tax=Willisornis vidua TaxID=1566151 RepID=A0ABQ9DC53_9PASS|nr:Neuropeptide-like protein C4orf48 like protein [Willisornis vidua]